jgi:hypothetical protein
MAYLEYLDFVDLALREAAKSFPSSPKVVGLHRKLGVDAGGEDAVHVWVILADDTPEGELRHEKFQPIADAIRASIRDGFANVRLNLRPFVWFRLKSEHERLMAGAA